MKINKAIIPLIALALLSSCNNNPIPSASISTNSEDSSISENPSTSDSVTPENYYNGITATKGTALLAQVHDLITRTHTYYTSYSDCKDKLNLIHTDSYDETHLTELYSQSAWQIEDANATSPGHLNREHLWCKANSAGLWKDDNPVGGGADLHHVRPAEYDINSTRGNYKYGNVTNRDSYKAYATTTSSSTIHAGYLNGVFEPLDSVKGDVARICMYVYTHYNSYKYLAGATTNGSGPASYFGNLPITNNVSGGFATLLEWNTSDPVSQQELDRNNYLFTKEGNRNPFIDHPEYAANIWGA